MYSIGMTDRNILTSKRLARWPFLAGLYVNCSQGGSSAASNFQSETNSKMDSVHTRPFRICPGSRILPRWKITCKRIWRHNTLALGSIFTASTSYLQSKIRISLVTLSIDCLRHSQLYYIPCWKSWYTDKLICALQGWNGEHLQRCFARPVNTLKTPCIHSQFKAKQIQRTIDSLKNRKSCYSRMYSRWIA